MLEMTPKDLVGSWESRTPCTLKKAADSAFISCLTPSLYSLSPKGTEE